MNRDLDRGPAPEQGHLMRNKTFQRFVAAVGITVALTAFIACSDKEYEKPTFTPLPTVEYLVFTDERIIAQEAKRWGVSSSANETKIWQTEGYGKLPYKRPVDKETIKEATERLPKVLELMEKSENLYLNQSATFLLNLYASGQLTFSLETKPIMASHAKTTALAVAHIVEQGKLHFLIMIDAEEMINNSSSTLFALQLAHESEHIKNSMNIIASLHSSLTPQEIIRKEIERSKNIDEFIQEESRAWAWESRAYIHQYGLGFRGLVGTNIEKAAVAFIHNSNGSPETPEWQRYVAQEILGIKNWQPKGN